ncbi:MAG: WcaI family glycosyltransferase [Hyphomicrobiales bacterium]
MKQKILVYGMNHAPEMAGVGVYTGDIAAGLAARGHDVAVVTTPPHYPGWQVRDGWSAWRWQAEILDGVRVYRCPLLLLRPMSGIRRLIAPASFALSSAPVALLQALLRRPNVLLVVEPTLFVAPLAFVAARLVGARLVLHVQDLEVDAAFAVGHLASRKGLMRLAFAFERRILGMFDRIVTISSRMAGRLAAKGVAADRLAVVRNWVDLDRIRPHEGENPYRAELGLAAGDFVALYSGNIGRKQNLEVLLDAARMLENEPGLGHVRVLVAGEGPEKPRLVAEYGGLANVRFLPFQPAGRLAEFLSLPDLHVLTQEAGAADLVLPSKLGGMLASGRPIAVTANEGTELHAFLGDAAAIVPPGDAAALAGVIRRAVAEGAIRDVPGALRRAELAASLSRSAGHDCFTAALIGDLESFADLTPDGGAAAGEAAE